MKKASIIIIPSTWQEPFGLTAMEGLSNRMAVIANNVGGLCDIVRDNGILIDNINHIKINESLIDK